MRGKTRPHGRPDRPDREFPFVPRIINPVKVRDVVLFSADEIIRASQRIIQDQMPRRDFLKTRQGQHEFFLSLSLQTR